MDDSLPELIDNTMRSAWKVCQHQFHRSHVEHLAGIEPSVHLHAGGAFASGLEVGRRAFYDEGASEDEARRQALQEIIRFYGPVEFPPTRNGDKSLSNVINAFDSYMQEYGGFSGDVIKPVKAKDGHSMVEFRFSIPTEVNHPETGNPILYGGRADMIGEQGGAIYVTDEKTATQLGEQWANNWILDSQFTGYIAAARLHGWPVAGAVVRGIGLLKTKITHQQSIVFREEWQVHRWWEELNGDLEDMVYAWKNKRFKRTLSKHACNAFGGCEFALLCQSPNPEQWVPVNFRRRVWNPIAVDSGEALLARADVDASIPPELNIPGLT